MPHRYFSQHGEDFLLWSVFGDQPTGFFVDIGAFDGVLFSNTLSFEQAGWQGVCVEAHPVYFEHCQQARPGSVCLHAACVGDAASPGITFYADELGLFSGVLAGRDAELTRRYCWLGGREFQGFASIQVPAMTLDQILDAHLPAHAKIDFVSIDVEGSELDVLRGFDLARRRPRVLLVEAQTREAAKALSTYLAEHGGYRPARTHGVNIVYARERAVLRQLRRTVIDCHLEPQVHPLAAQYPKLDRRDSRRVFSAPPHAPRALMAKVQRRLRCLAQRLFRQPRRP